MMNRNEANNESTGRCVTSTTTMADVKALAPFLQRADEMSRADPKVAYYCRMYAVEEGMKAKERSAELNALMGELLKQLESTKAGAALAETREEDELYLENFAMKLFAKADKADRANKRDAKTAKMFYVSGVFIEILNQFGPLNEDMGEKQRYAAWRGAELSGAAREGKTPPPPPDDTTGTVPQETGPSGGDASNGGGEESTPGAGDADVERTEPAPPEPPAWLPPAPHHPVSPPSAPPMPPHAANGHPSAPPNVVYGNAPPGLPPPNYNTDNIGIPAIADAQMHAKFAVSALAHEDVHTAIDNLRKALAVLTTK